MGDQLMPCVTNDDLLDADLGTLAKDLSDWAEGFNVGAEAHVNGKSKLACVIGQVNQRVATLDQAKRRIIGTARNFTA